MRSAARVGIASLPPALRFGSLGADLRRYGLEQIEDTSRQGGVCRLGQFAQGLHMPEDGGLGPPADEGDHGIGRALQSIVMQLLDGGANLVEGSDFGGRVAFLSSACRYGSVWLSSEPYLFSGCDCCRG